VTTTTIAIIAGGRPAAAGTTTTIAAARCRHGTMKAGSPVPGHATTTMMTTGAAAATMVAGSVTPKVTRRLLVGAGRSAKAPLAVALGTTTGVARGHVMTIMTIDVMTARATRKAGLPARGRDRVMTMTVMTGAAAATMAAGSVIAPGTRRLLVEAGRSAKAPPAVEITTTGIAHGHGMSIMTTDVTIARETRKAGLLARGRDRVMTMTTGAAAESMAAGSVTPKVMRKLLGTGAVSLRF
jgi:hypothetical protein